MENQNQPLPEGQISLRPFALTGHVTDNRLRPLPKAKIFYQEKVIGESGTDGYFAITIAKPTASRIALTFSKEGHVPNTRVFNAKLGGGGNVAIVIWPARYQLTFGTQTELDIELDGSRIQIPANAFVDAKGKTFKDPAKLLFTLFDITNPFERAAASGDYSGRLSNGSTVRLNSYGIFSLDVQGPIGQSLKLRSEAKIGFSIAVPASLAKAAPPKAGYFDMDQNQGIWVQAGDFVFNSERAQFVGSTNTLTPRPRNIDVPLDTTCVTIKVVNMFDNTPLANMQVVAHGFQSDSYGTSDANGNVCLVVQRNASFTVTAYGAIGSTQYLTPFPTSFTSPDIGSNATNCGNPTTCPFLGLVQMTPVVGIPQGDYSRKLQAR